MWKCKRRKITGYKFNAMEKYTTERLNIVKMCIIPNDYILNTIPIKFQKALK